MAFVGVDGCPDGWIAVVYDEQGYREAELHASLADLWEAHRGAERVLVDVPIGLREDTAEPRACDADAREVLGSPRAASVFPTPVRAVLEADSYEQARRIQEKRTGASLPAPTWGIVAKMREAEALVRADEAARERLREAHPEVCWWAMNDGEPARYGKTAQPAAAAAERLAILEGVDPDACGAVRSACEGLEGSAGVDDVLDGFALALSAGPATGALAFLPREADRPPHDPRGVPMAIAYPQPR